MYIQIQTTFDKRDDARTMATGLLDARLVSCAQIGEITSLYNWDGKRHETPEFVLTMKTRAELYDKCEAHIKQSHRYECPQIIATPIIHGSKDYLEWIKAGTQ